MRVTPKISDSPAATRNSDDAPASPLRSWTTKPEKLIEITRACRGSGVDLRQIGPVGGRVERVRVMRSVQSAARSFFTSASVGWNLAPSR